jgi:hypothetical protein
MIILLVIYKQALITSDTSTQVDLEYHSLSNS